MPDLSPRPSRMTSPGYGFENATAPPGERFPWSRVEKILADARNFWIATARVDGRPHAAPVWALWLDGALYFSTGKESRKARNLAANANVVVHVESPSGVIVILVGRAEELSDEATVWRVWDAYKEKYNWDASGYPFYLVRPTVAFSFEEQLGETATRWTFAA
jgi:nitroimidazol reductase NimA-like FMN-containing flavoprotein (pyridoxamine 5'-phosphate oxidase superfamily)